MTEQVKYLLGGYATGTLTPEENAALMQAALEDQELFNALADDESLRRYLAEPEFRNDLLKATEPKPHRMRWITALATAAACLFAALFWTTHRTSAPTQEMAINRPQPVAPPPGPAYGVQSVQVKPAAPKRPVNRKPQAPHEPKTDQVAPPSPVPPMQPATKAPPAVRAEAAGTVNQETASSMNGQLSVAAPPPGASFSPRASMMAKTAIQRLPVTARITDVNAAIVTIDKGSTADVRVGDLLDVLHDNLKIGFVVVTTAEPGFSVGRYSGSILPLIGDTAQTPKK
jgi:hypothetical protein